jgi:transcriptional regulator with XRE-family HTH domain
MDVRDFFSAQTYLQRNIRFLRKAMGWSQEELAARIGLNRGNIASYENGTAEPKIGNLLKMSLLFGIGIHDLAHKDLEREPVAENTNLPAPFPSVFDPGALLEYAQRAQELQDVMNGLRTCCKFKLKTIEEASVNDLQIVAMHFEELFNTAQSLMQEHLALLQLLGGLPSTQDSLPGQGPLSGSAE